MPTETDRHSDSFKASGPGAAADNSDRDGLVISTVTHAYSAAPGAPASPVLSDISLRLAKGEFASIVGPSGCGKSTLLNLISGLAVPTSGTIAIDGQVVKSVRRDVGFIFQRDALLPWRTVEQNVQMPMKFRKTPKQETRARASEWLKRFGLEAFAHRYPHQLSGGERKRAAIAATLVYEPKLLLMDEPFSALDIQTRDLIEMDIQKAWEAVRDQTVVFVTHDLEEAIAVSDRVFVISRGPGTVKAEYHIDLDRPRNLMEIRTTERFREYHRAIWNDLRDEVLAAARTRGYDLGDFG